jgi:carboxypeptidase T
MNLIAKVTSSGPQKPLGDVLRTPLGIDVWEVKPDHLILRGTEAQLDRLSSMGYVVEQLEDVERHLSAFTTAGAAEQYHSAATLGEELRRLAEARPDIAELIEIGRSIEGRPILALRIGDRRGGVPKVLFMGTTRESGSPWRCPSCSRRISSSGPTRRRSQTA